jgi:hypothetical protein
MNTYDRSPFTALRRLLMSSTDHPHRPAWVDISTTWVDISTPDARPSDYRTGASPV